VLTTTAGAKVGGVRHQIKWGIPPREEQSCTSTTPGFVELAIQNLAAALNAGFIQYSDLGQMLMVGPGVKPPIDEDVEEEE